MFLQELPLLCGGANDRAASGLDVGRQEGSEDDSQPLTPRCRSEPAPKHFPANVAVAPRQDAGQESGPSDEEPAIDCTGAALADERTVRTVLVFFQPPHRTAEQAAHAENLSRGSHKATSLHDPAADDRRVCVKLEQPQCLPGPIGHLRDQPIIEHGDQRMGRQTLQIATYGGARQIDAVNPTGTGVIRRPPADDGHFQFGIAAQGESMQSLPLVILFGARVYQDVDGRRRRPMAASDAP